MRTDYDSVCRGKTQHTTRAAARAQADQLRIVSPARGRRYNTYACPYCQHFHVGHISAAQARRRGRRNRYRGTLAASAS